MTTYYVATTGSASGNGSASSPFRTIQSALNAGGFGPGDEIVVKSGTYHEQVKISKDGAPGNPVVIRSEVPGGAKIVPPGDKGFGVVINANYVKLDGFEISGAGRAGVAVNHSHHVTISNNEVHDNVGSGISVGRSDFITVEGNVTHGNASGGPYSGISIYHPVNVTGDNKTDGFRIIVRDNVSYDNVTRNGAHTDGNGIIMDDFRSTKDGSIPAYLFPSLVENNLVYSNGGKGIQVAWSDHVTVRGNTAWHNNVDSVKAGTWHGELSNMNSSHNTWVDNIAVASLGISKYATAIDNTSFVGYKNTDLTWHNNLTYNGNAGDDSIRVTNGNSSLSNGSNLLGVNPKFVNAPANFKVQSDSPAHALGADLSGGGGGSGTDVISGSDLGVTKQGGWGSETINGTTGNDHLSGNAGNDKLFGLGGADKLFGGTGSDKLDGGNGHDALTGGLGKDFFIFHSTDGAGKGTLADDIMDFSRAQGDKIDLSDIDANTKVGGNQGFAFIGDKGFSGHAGQLRYENGRIAGDVNGDKVADFHIELANHHGLQASDFLL